ncbi:hypothetical protein EW026_g7768 [Hermanssonia centrifuga]|uniref:Uncharacterized protein n=1 Tax=Hermanssonia centrifuga TaxID=98765 RepID=A0A4S4K7R5_9APHY|nr:hypothetical protein EW026_g7768 [Hermanssonia centrifuga]
MSAQILQVTAGIALPEDIEMLFGSFGAGLVGSWIAMALYGLAVAQTYVYFVQYPQDSLWMKALVCSLESLSTLHAIFMAHAIYEIMTNAFSIVAIDATVWSLPASIAVRIVVNCVILLYFVKLCVQLSRRAIRWWLTATLVAPIFIYLAFGLDTVIRMSVVLLIPRMIIY